MSPLRLSSPRELIAHLDLYVEGQSRAKRALASAAYRHYLGLSAGSGSPDFGRQHLMLIGPTGCGKTLLVKTLAQYLGVPFSYANTSRMVDTGIVGLKASDALLDLIMCAKGDVNAAEHGIVFLDEIDKIASGDRGDSVGWSTTAVQHEFLSMLDGQRMTLKVDRYKDDDIIYSIDTSKILFIGAGAFTGLEEITAKRAGRNVLGFGKIEASGEANDHEADPFAQVLPEDIEEFGMIPELIGRFAGLVGLQPLAKEDLVRILASSRGSALEKQRRFFEIHGIGLTVHRSACEAIAEKSLEMGTGARALDKTLLESIQEIAWRVDELWDEGAREVIVTRDSVLGRGAPLIAPYFDDQPRPEPESKVFARAAAMQIDPERAKRLEGIKAQLADPGKAQRETREALERMKNDKLAWGAASMKARAAWRTLEESRPDDITEIFALAELAVEAGLNIDEIHRAGLCHRASSVESLKKLVPFWGSLSYRERAVAVRRDKAATTALEHVAASLAVPRVAELFESNRFKGLSPMERLGEIYGRMSERGLAIGFFRLSDIYDLLPDEPPCGMSRESLQPISPNAALASAIRAGLEHEQVQAFLESERFFELPRTERLTALIDEMRAAGTVIPGCDLYDVKAALPFQLSACVCNELFDLPAD